MDYIANSLAYKRVYDGRLKTISPLVCGLGALHVLETSITLHHIWGVPYIPGSSLKGVCRQVVFWRFVEKRGMSEGEAQDFQKKFDEKLQKDDKEILKYQLLFGAQDFKGLLLFLDAYPTEGEKLLRLEIMNPHYSSYYRGETKEAGDWENPIPVFFLTVKEGVPFRFVVLFDQYRWERIKEKYKEINLEIGNKEIEDIIKEALNLYGVGSKTRLGYGLFE
ncbi:MAG: type III-B CRISPR module RAMP protein Cmr6 [Aquificaceae bacterium]